MDFFRSLPLWIGIMVVFGGACLLLYFRKDANMSLWKMIAFPILFLLFLISSMIVGLFVMSQIGSCAADVALEEQIARWNMPAPPLPSPAKPLLSDSAENLARTCSGYCVPNIPAYYDTTSPPPRRAAFPNDSSHTHFGTGGPQQ